MSSVATNNTSLSSPKSIEPIEDCEKRSASPMTPRNQESRDYLQEICDYVNNLTRDRGSVINGKFNELKEPFVITDIFPNMFFDIDQTERDHIIALQNEWIAHTLTLSERRNIIGKFIILTNFVIAKIPNYDEVLGHIAILRTNMWDFTKVSKDSLEFLNNFFNQHDRVRFTDEHVQTDGNSSDDEQNVFIIGVVWTKIYTILSKKTQ